MDAYVTSIKASERAITNKLVMEQKRTAKSVLGWMMMMLVTAALVLTMPAVSEAHLPQEQPVTCIKHCLKDCKLKGVLTATCLKYCPVHCLPPNALEKEHICKLSCMLDTCAKYSDDEKKTTECVTECHKVHCKSQR